MGGKICPCVHDYMEDRWSEEPDESNEEMFEEEDDETLWKSDEEDVVEMDLDDPDVFAFLYMFYMEHADCTGCKMQEGDEI